VCDYVIGGTAGGEWGGGLLNEDEYLGFGFGFDWWYFFFLIWFGFFLFLLISAFDHTRLFLPSPDIDLNSPTYIHYPHTHTPMRTSTRKKE